MLAGLAKSRGDARRLLEQGGLAVNGRKIGAAERLVAPEARLHGRWVLLKKGGREYALLRFPG